MKLRRPTTRQLRQFRRQVSADLKSLWASCYMAPTDARLITILGGTTLTIGALRKHDGRQFTIVLSRGRLLRSERFRRAVVDERGMLANDVQAAIRILGPEYERDVVASFELDERMKADGWRVRNIPARWLYEQPERVRASVRQFVYS